MEQPISSRFDRQSGLVPMDRLQSTWATIIGVGSIGRQVAIQLAALGVPKLQLIDPDRVEPVNITAQAYLRDDLERPKVQATADLCQQIEPLLDVEEIQDRYRRAHETAPVVFTCVDSIGTRAAIWRALGTRCQFWADGRMLGETLRVLVAGDEASRRHYPSTLFPEAEAELGRCTARSTNYAATIAAGLMVHQFVRFLRGMPLDPDALFNLAAGEYTLFPVAA